MNILVITQHLGLTAPGIVFENIINGLSKLLNVTVITYHNNTHNQEPTRQLYDIIELEEPIFINIRWTYYLNRLWYQIFNISWTDMVAKSQFSMKKQQYDLVFALCSMGNTIPLSVSKKINSRYGIPIAAYFVDAIPTPVWWTKRKITNGVKRYLKSYTKNLVYFASSNEDMLEYQKQFLHPSCTNCDVILTPSNSYSEIAYLKKNNQNKFIFLYTGSIYGLRNPKSVIDAFCEFVEEYPKSELHFVGNANNFLSKANYPNMGNIKIYEYSNDLTEHYRSADVLIDINADYPNDIFLSSKIANYLLIPKPIICVTGENSPANKILRCIDSIFLVRHKREQIYEAMKAAAHRKFNFEDRKDIIKRFSAQNVIDKLSVRLKEIYK